MRIEFIKPGNNVPKEVNVIIEEPADGETIKYAMDTESGNLVVDRFLYHAKRCAGQYCRITLP